MSLTKEALDMSDAVTAVAVQRAMKMVAGPMTACLSQGNVLERVSLVQRERQPDVSTTSHVRQRHTHLTAH